MCHADNHSIVDETETDDNVKACVPCPFCYLEIEVHMICSHLQEEHCFEMKNAVCAFLYLIDPFYIYVFCHSLSIIYF